MSAALKVVVRALVPAGVRDALRAALGWRWFVGNYATWAEARADAGGYQAAAIVERVLAATRAVREGRAAFERDGVLFAEPAPEPAVLAALRRIAADAGGRLRVLDFGGALGTTYWRHRAQLAGLRELRWDIVEQPRFVAAGRQECADTPLRFFDAVEATAAEGPYDVLLASTSLQYLESPGAELARWMARGFPWLLLNNLPLHPGAPDRLAVQRVPPSIYPASYPVWFFNREHFLARFKGRYAIETEYAAEAVWWVGWRRYPSTGLLLRRQEAP